jgi:hypothetical protein
MISSSLIIYMCISCFLDSVSTVDTVVPGSVTTDNITNVGIYEITLNVTSSYMHQWGNAESYNMHM